jgi:hypothetical protein
VQRSSCIWQTVSILAVAALVLLLALPQLQPAMQK